LESAAEVRIDFELHYVFSRYGPQRLKPRFA
jgi:hypothetical protein